MSTTPTTITTLPILYGTDKAGRKKSWEASVTSKEDGAALATITYGLVEGKKQTTFRVYSTGKNLGKSNETSPFEQAVLETQSKWKDKREKEGYLPSMGSPPVVSTSAGGGGSILAVGEGAPSELASGLLPPPQEKIFPMLAHVFDPTNSKSRLRFPCYLQPKLDGVRCICYLSADASHVVAQSRTGTAFESLGHITSELLGPFQQIPELGRGSGFALDGELYTDTMPFEQLVGLVKKKKLTTEDREKLTQISYHVYDVVDLRGTMPFQQRYQLLSHLHQRINAPHLCLVSTVLAQTVEEFRSFFATVVEEGYEGVMLRNLEGTYRCNYRSHDLQKYKEFCEAEYEICGYREAEGRDRGTVVWVCRLPHEAGGTEFSVRPRGTLEMRRKWFEEGASYFGKQLTVIYQELSEHGVPRFPVGKSIREGY